jgi:DNA-directed RNA polymerase specialized sigma24 family protein
VSVLPHHRPMVQRSGFRDAPSFGPDVRTRMRVDWQRLRTRRWALGRAAGWGLLPDPVRDLDDVLLAVGGGPTGGEIVDPRAEAKLRALLAVAAHDDLAARVAIERIAPGLVTVAARRRRQGHADAIGELFATAWITVRTFDPRRQPRCLAAALVDDADHRAFRAAHRRRSAGERPVAIDGDGPAAGVADLAGNDRPNHPAVELGELFVLAADVGMPRDELDLLRRLLVAGSVDEVAVELEVSDRTVRNRRARAAARLRAIAVAA